MAAFIALERAIDRHRLAAQRHEAKRQAGVCWSGLSSAPSPLRTEAQLRRAAEERVRCQERWEASPQGVALTAIAQIQRACEATHAAAEQARSAAARSLPHNPAPCAAALAEARDRAADLLRGLRQARRALTNTDIAAPAD